MSNRNSLLADIVTASGGTVRNPDNRNALLEDWLLALGGNPPPAFGQLVSSDGISLFSSDSIVLVAGDE